MTSVLAGLKVSSMICKCVFCRPELAKGDPMDLNFQSLQMKHANG